MPGQSKRLVKGGLIYYWKAKKKVCYCRTYPIVVIKLVVKEPSENRKRRQLLPTPTRQKSVYTNNLAKE